VSRTHARRLGEAAALLAVAVLAGLYAGGGCAKSESQAVKHELTERERDSVIATESALPGSGVVGKAMAISDSAAVRASATTPTTP
jgi:hypothetical protein